MKEYTARNARFGIVKGNAKRARMHKQGNDEVVGWVDGDVLTEID
jgi:hypothetical protein